MSPEEYCGKFSKALLDFANAVPARGFKLNGTYYVFEERETFQSLAMPGQEPFVFKYVGPCLFALDPHHDGDAPMVSFRRRLAFGGVAVRPQR